eukprot:3940241-Prymnesium_polylepis.1
MACTLGIGLSLGIAATGFTFSAPRVGADRHALVRSAGIVLLDPGQAASELHRAQADALEHLVSTLALFEREPFYTPLGTVWSFANEQPAADVRA